MGPKPQPRNISSSYYILECHLRQQRLTRLGFLLGLRDRHNRISLRCHGKILSLDRWLGGVCLLLYRAGHLSHIGRRRSRATVVDVLGSFVAVVSKALFHQAGCVVGALASEFLQVVDLFAEGLLRVVNLRIDDFAVADVDERADVDSGSTDQRQSPEWEDSDESVRDESSGESLSLTLEHCQPYLPVEGIRTATV